VKFELTVAWLAVNVGCAVVLKTTWLAVNRPVPKIVTAVPLLPVVGVKLEMDGGTVVTEIVTVAVLLLASPSLALKVNESLPAYPAVGV
jgi:hypothetical protein